jgi:hypothetical protein
MSSFRYLLLLVVVVVVLKCGCSAHAYNRGPTGAGSIAVKGVSDCFLIDKLCFPKKIGDRPGYGPRFVRGRGRSPVPVPDLSGIGDAPPPSPGRGPPDLSRSGTRTGTLPRPIPIGGSAPWPRSPVSRGEPSVALRRHRPIQWAPCGLRGHFCWASHGSSQFTHMHTVVLIS